MNPTSEDGDVSNDMTLDIQGPAAKVTAQQVLDTLGVETHEVEEFRAVITNEEDGEQTQTVLDSSGPHAGQLAKSMVGSVNWDQTPPRRLHVELRTRNGHLEEDNTPSPQTSRQEPQDDVEEDEDEEDTTTDQDPETYESGDWFLTAETNMHTTLTALACYYAKTDSSGTEVNGAMDFDGNGESRKIGVTVKQIAQAVDVDLTTDQMTKAFYQLRQDGFVEVVGKEKNKHRYTMTSVGWEALEVLGQADGVEDFDFDETIRTDFGRPGARGERDSGKQYTTPNRGEMGREEPDVDSPKPVKPGTRKHEVLTMLNVIAEEYGEEHWISVGGLNDCPDVQHTFPNTTALSTALSELFLNRGQCERKKDGNRCLYRINRSGQAEINRIGENENVLK